jgi:uncharacterized protein YqgQ
MKEFHSINKSLTHFSIVIYTFSTMESHIAFLNYKLTVLFKNSWKMMHENLNNIAIENKDIKFWDFGNIN